MTFKESIDTINRANDVLMGKIGEMDDYDQMKLYMAIMKYAQLLKPLVDKYDMNKPFKFEIKRLDEI